MSSAQDFDEGDQWLDGFIPYLLYRVAMKSNAGMLAKVRAQKINPSQWRVLAVLKSYGKQSMGAIADLTRMEQPTVSRVVAQLEKSGRVTRQFSVADGRVAEVSLTEKGEATFNEIVPAALRHHDLAIEGLSRKELTALIGTLAKIEKNLGFYD